MWQVRWRNRAEDDLYALPSQVRQRVVTAIDRLAETGQGQVRKLQGQPAEWRLRVGDWRIRFVFDYPNRTIEVLRVLHRREAYR